MTTLLRRTAFSWLFLATTVTVPCSYAFSQANADTLNKTADSATTQQDSTLGGTMSGELTIGGQKIVKLVRHPTEGLNTPEFLSATVLPGRGMNLFQITAKLPGKGVVDVLASPSLKEAAEILNDGPDDRHGVKSFSFGGAFLVPYVNRIRGKLTPNGQDITTEWRGKTLTLPADWKGKKPNAELHAIHGLILDRKTDELKVQTSREGQSATGIIHAGNFGGAWLSQTDLEITISLSATAVDAAITATNVGATAEPIGIGWHPYFAIPSGDRSQARLHIPALHLAEVNNYDDVFPTGKLMSVQGTKYDFTTPPGKPLNDMYLDDNFSNLVRTQGEVVVNLVDPAADYGLHIEGLSDAIKTIQVYAPPDKPFAVVEEQFNFADPFRPIWGNMDTGMVTLEPGHSVTWHARLKLFVPQKQQAQNSTAN